MAHAKNAKWGSRNLVQSSMTVALVRSGNLACGKDANHNQQQLNPELDVHLNTSVCRVLPPNDERHTSGIVS